MCPISTSTPVGCQCRRQETSSRCHRAWGRDREPRGQYFPPRDMVTYYPVVMEQEDFELFIHGVPSLLQHQGKLRTGTLPPVGMACSSRRLQLGEHIQWFECPCPARAGVCLGQHVDVLNIRRYSFSFQRPGPSVLSI